VRYLAIQGTHLASWSITDASNDWSVLLNGEAVGRIHPVVGNPTAIDRWQWFVTLPLASPGHGTTPTMEEAKACWREAWDRLVERVGQVAIDRAMADAREAAERNRRWAEMRSPRMGRRSKQVIN
jgi:hypothetical protein